jgi:pilus assembly protein Flp/PilA
LEPHASQSLAKLKTFASGMPQRDERQKKAAEWQKRASRAKLAMPYGRVSRSRPKSHMRKQKKEDGIMLYVKMLLNQLKKDAFRLKKDENGAALVEYTVLLGIMLGAVIGVISTVTPLVLGHWHALAHSAAGG